MDIQVGDRVGFRCSLGEKWYDGCHVVDTETWTVEYDYEQAD